MSLDKPVETVLRKRFSRIQIVESLTENGIERLVLPKRHLVDALLFLQQDPDTQLDFLIDIAATHRRAPQSAFEVCYVLRSTRLHYRVFINVVLPSELPSLPTIVGIYPNANWYEREMWDLFGIYIEGHPDLRRLFMSEAYIGHPLRKDHV